MSMDTKMDNDGDPSHDDEKRLDVKKSKSKANAKKIKLWGAVALGVIIAFIAIQNRHGLEVRILFWNPEVPGIILLPFIFLLGVAVGYIMRRKPKPRPVERP